MTWRSKDHESGPNKHCCAQCGMDAGQPIELAALGDVTDEHHQFCSACGAPISAPRGTRPWHRSSWLIALLVTAVLAVGIVTAILATLPHAQVPSNAPTGSANPAIQRWWSAAQEHFTELQRAVDNTRNSARTGDLAGLRDACGQLDEAGAVKLQAHLPTPDPDLTTEIQAMINEYRDASHMCVSILDGSNQDYSGEIKADMDAAAQHMQEALDVINQNTQRAA